MAPSQASQFISTGIKELDHVLGGGIVPHRLYMLEGVPGSGKTTLGMQFLLTGLQRGERVLYVTLSETREEIRGIAESHGWDIGELDILEVLPDERELLPSEQYTVFEPEEVELGATISRLLEHVERTTPSRVVLDSLSELRLLAGSPLRYRRQMLGLKQFFAGRQCSVFVLDDRTATAEDPQLQSIAHGIIALEQHHPDFGAERRRLRVVKYRGVQFVGGFHDYRIERGGLALYPRVIAAHSRRERELSPMSSGVAGLDALLGGGLDRGTSTLVTGAAGTGKSTLAALFAVAAAQRGERAAMFLFDENITTLRTRMRGIGTDLDVHMASGRLTIQQVDPAELSPGEFAHLVATTARDHDASLIVIDSLNGYLNAMPDAKFLSVQLHELLAYLGNMGTSTLLVMVQMGMIGAHMQNPIDASYLADTVLLMRYFEAGAEVRKALSVLKKRSGPHERTIREFEIRSSGIDVGAPLYEFHGVLTGVPTYTGSSKPLIKDGHG